MRQSYIQNNFKVLKEQYEFMKEVTAELEFNEHTRHFVNHVTVSTFQNINRREDELSIPISSLLIRKKLRKMELNEAAKLLIIKPYSYLDGLCREYELPHWYLNEFVALGSKLSSQDYLEAEKVNLFTGERTRAPIKSVLYDENRNYEPEIIRQAIKVITDNGCKFNQSEVEHHVKDIEAEKDRCAREFGLESRQYIKANGRYINDDNCFKRVLDQNPIATDTLGISQYVPAYEVASTGRIIQKHGCLQSCSRKMKKVAYSGIQGLKNIDLKSSQLCVLVLEFIKAGIDPSWIEGYISERDSKHRYAEMAGMSVDCWKQCLLALVMGACFPERINYITIKYRSILRTLLKETADDKRRADDLRIKLYRVVAPFMESLDKWHEHLLTDFIEQNKVHSKKGTYIVNGVDKKMYIDELNLKARGRRKSKSRLAAFLLHGVESAFINALTVSSLKYGFHVLSNEHDGLVIIGDIPDEAVREARRSSGFENAEIAEKDFI